MESGIHSFSVRGVFIAADSMHRSILCKLAVPNKLDLEIKHYFIIQLPFIFNSSTLDDLLCLLNNKHINLGSFLYMFDSIWYKL